MYLRGMYLYILYFRMPSSFRKETSCLKRYIWFWVFSGVQIARIWIYTSFGVVFSIVPQEYQWLLGLISPILREIVMFLSFKASYKAAGEEDSLRKSIYFVCSHYAETSHAVAIAVIISGVATTESTLCILGMDFIINVYHGIKIIRMHRAGTESKNSKMFLNISIT